MWKSRCMVVLFSFRTLALFHYLLAGMASVLKDVMFLYYIDHNVFNLICFYGFPFITGFHQFDYDMLWYYFVCVCVCVCLSAWVSLSYLAVWFYGFNQIWEKKKKKLGCWKIVFPSFPSGTLITYIIALLEMLQKSLSEPPLFFSFPVLLRYWHVSCVSLRLQCDDLICAYTAKWLPQQG